MDFRVDSLDGFRSSFGFFILDIKVFFEVYVREKFNRMVEVVDRIIEKRIDKFIKELV